MHSSPANDDFPRPVADLRMIEMPEIVAGKPLVQLRQHRVGRGQRRDEIGVSEQQAVARRVE
jgi:hypothetical protein